MLQDVLDRRFRANRAFDLVPPDQLPEHLRPSPESAAEALLVPNGQTAVTAKALNADATALVRSLHVAGHLPSGTSGVAANAAVARLVLDGALEIEHHDGFVSGPRAHGAVFATGEPASPRGRLGELSADALRYAAALGLGDVGELSWRLYGYGAIPRSTRWERLLDGDLSARLDGYEAHVNPGWLAWTRREQRAELPFKLYVSPQPVELGACFDALTHVLVEHEAPSFKVGRGVHGRLRPDKLVVYLPDFDRLQRLASAVRQALAGVPAHGVPFTAEASPDGLLSWGMDPPDSERIVSAQPQESWRLWVTNRLAGAVVHAQTAACSVAPWRFALDRLALEGVDPATWLPSGTLWTRLELE